MSFLTSILRLIDQCGGNAEVHISLDNGRHTQSNQSQHVNLRGGGPFGSRASPNDAEEPRSSAPSLRHPREDVFREAMESQDDPDSLDITDHISPDRDHENQWNDLRDPGARTERFYHRDATRIQPAAQSPPPPLEAQRPAPAVVAGQVEQQGYRDPHYPDNRIFRYTIPRSPLEDPRPAPPIPQLTTSMAALPPEPVPRHLAAHSPRPIDQPWRQSPAAIAALQRPDTLWRSTSITAAPATRRDQQRSSTETAPTRSRHQPYIGLRDDPHHPRHHDIQVYTRPPHWRPCPRPSPLPSPETRPRPPTHAQTRDAATQTPPATPARTWTSQPTTPHTLDEDAILGDRVLLRKLMAERNALWVIARRACGWSDGYIAESVQTEIGGMVRDGSQDGGK